MTNDNKVKTLGQAIDEIIGALTNLNEKDREVAIRTSCLHFSLSLLNELGGSTTAPVSIGGQLPAAPSISSSQLPTDIRSLKEQKNPSSDREMACLVAYYLQNLAPANERQETISTADLKKYFMQANYPLPKAIQQTLKNAQAAGYFDSAERGSFRLNPVGYNLVVHGLPRGELTAFSGNKFRNGKKKKTAKKKR